MKTIKRIFITLIVLIVLLVAAVLAHPFWVGPTVKCCAEKIGPSFTGTPIALENCEINLYKGAVGFDGFALDNPHGCKAEKAASLGTARVEIDPLSLTSDVVVIREITIKDLFLSYDRLEGKSNIDHIVDHATGADKSAEKSADEKQPETTTEVKPTEETAESKNAAVEKKVIIDKITISGIKLSLFGMPVAVPVDVNLKDIGRESNGIGIADAFDTVCEKILNAIGMTSEQLKLLSTDVLNLGQLGLDKGVEGISNTVEAVKNIDLQNLKDSGKQLEEAGKQLESQLKGLFK